MNTERYTKLDTETRLLDKVESTLRAMDSSAPHVWINRYSADELRGTVRELAARADNGEELPLLGITVAVKDNIDVAGLPTTCAAPWTSCTPQRDATCVGRLRKAGAIILGKTNMDQFATGLVGTRSPYGPVSSVNDSDLVSGGSSSGSAVAVASGQADIALGTDTAGSGRVPAAFNGIFGIKPTVGLIPVTGVTPACPSFDVVSIFCRDLALGQRALDAMVGDDDMDPHVRRFSPTAPLSMSHEPVLAAPSYENLKGMDAHWLEVFENELQVLSKQGLTVRRLDITVLLETAKLLYGGALVAERYSSVGRHYAQHLDVTAGEDPTVRGIVLNAGQLSADAFVDDQQQLLKERLEARRLLNGADILITPTTVCHPSIAEVEADPVNVNSKLGRFTNFVNLLDFAGIALPAAADRYVGITLLADAFHDYALLDFACCLLRNRNGGMSCNDAPPMIAAPIGKDVFVVGEHMRGLSLNRELEKLGARYEGEARTDRHYSLVKLDTNPVKPTLIRHETTSDNGIDGELWRLPDSGVVSLLTALPRPMALGPVTLSDGRTVIGFGIDASVTENSQDISSYGGWREYLNRNPSCPRHKRGHDE